MRTDLLRWDFSQFGPYNKGVEFWDQDFKNLENSFDASLDVKLFNYAYAKTHFKSEHTLWQSKLNALQGGDRTITALDGLRSMRNQFCEDEMSLFQWQTSLFRPKRVRALDFDIELIESMKEPLFYQVQKIFMKQGGVTLDHRLSNYRPSGLKKFLRKSTKDWLDFGFPMSQRDPFLLKSEVDLFKLAKDFFSGQGALEIEELSRARCLDILSHPDKNSGAFTLPMPYGHRPLVYLHEVKNYESVLGLIHELTHGIYFSNRRELDDGCLIPDDCEVEAIPQVRELEFCRDYFSDPDFLESRVEALIAKPLFWYIFKARWIGDPPLSLGEAVRRWRLYLGEVFGSGFEWQPEYDLIWLGHRGMLQSLDETFLYVGGMLEEKRVRAAPNFSPKIK